MKGWGGIIFRDFLQDMPEIAGVHVLKFGRCLHKVRFLVFFVDNAILTSVGGVS